MVRRPYKKRTPKLNPYVREPRKVHGYTPMATRATVTPDSLTSLRSNHLRTWETMTQWAEHLEAHKEVFRPHISDNWASGGLTFEECFSQARHGDDSAVEVSDKYLDKLEHVADFNLTSFANTYSVAGSHANIPAMLAGQPCHMRQRRRIETQQAPLTIFASITSSCEIDGPALLKRGAAILALVRILSAKRPVTLWAGYALRERIRNDDLHIGAVRIDTSPLDLTRAAHILTHQSMARGFGVRAVKADVQDILNGYENGDGLPVALSRGDISLGASEKFIEEAFNYGGQSEVFIIGGAHSNDPLSDDPLAWLKEQVARFGHGASLP